MAYKYTGTGNSGTFAWLMQRISGIVVAICGLFIFYQLSFGDGGHGLDTWLLVPVLFFGVWHAFSGFKMITDDYVQCVRGKFILNVLYWAVGLATIALGMSMI